MQKIAFSDKYFLTAKVISGDKTMTRRAIPLRILQRLFPESHAMREDWQSLFPYKPGDIVAVAQSYRTIYEALHTQGNDVANDWWCHAFDVLGTSPDKTPGFTNKMFVRPELMPHKIRITDMKVERIQEISEEDCIREGIEHDSADGYRLWWYDIPGNDDHSRKLQNTLLRHIWDGKEGLWFWDTPQGAFSALINCICGDLFWARNPWVLVISFELLSHPSP